jgi:hypothetical protein
MQISQMAGREGEKLVHHTGDFKLVERANVKPAGLYSSIPKPRLNMSLLKVR